MKADNIDERLIDIPYKQLSSEALEGVLEEYATRGGYECDMPLEKRIGVLKKKLETGELKIVFDPEEETVNIVKRSRP
ncbi:YheU family protein [bacterium]|nr:YheU family protein [bacterium]